MRIRTVGSVAASLVLALALAAPAAAQGTAGPGTGMGGGLLGVGVSFLNVDIEGESETFKGFSVDFRKNVYSAGNIDVGVVGDVGWHRKGFSDFEGFDLDFTLLHFAGGVRVTGSQMERVAPFAQFLVGAARSSISGDINCDDADVACETDMLAGFGGGVDVRLTPRLNLRGQVDYFRVFTEDEGTNTWRFLVGISTLLGGS